MSNANNFLQNMGMQMPMFAAANPQQTSGDDVDLHDIFADYFNEDPSGQQLGGFAAAQQQQQMVGQVSLPTGSGIKTAWHTGALPSMAQQQQQQQGMEPAAKRSRGEDLYLPGQQQQQMGGGMPGGQSMGGTQQQQQMALAQAASGVGALSNRLGFNLQNTANAGIGSQMMGQQQSQGVLPTQQAAAAGMVNLPVGMGMKFGVGGNIMPPAGAPGGMTNGNIGGGMNAGMMSNVSSIAQQQLGGRVAVTNTQYGMSVPSGLGMMDKGRVEDQMAAERRLRNREHAKRSRVRKKFMLESLQQQVQGLQDENSTLRLLVQKHIPQHALKIIDDCCSKSVLFATGDKKDAAPQDATKDGDATETPLLRSDFSLIESLTSGQQNFVLSDPRLPDNPIVFASPGFFELTGYTREQVLGRNCRFLQGAGTDRKAIDVIRTAVANGTDATVCLLNYKADGTPFWNQLFVAALRDADNCIVNYVGVQSMIEPNAGASALEDKVNAAHPITVGVDGEGEEGNDGSE